jgi:hypothetical protein
MTTRTGTFPLRLPLSLKAAVEAIIARNGTSMNQFLVVADAEKIAAMPAPDRGRAARGRHPAEFPLSGLYLTDVDPTPHKPRRVKMAGGAIEWYGCAASRQGQDYRP